MGNLASQGTNNLSDTSKQDVICNIWDMASNCMEWSTETNDYTNGPCTSRGGIYNDSTIYTSFRIDRSNIDYYAISFRVLLYIEN